MTIYDELHFKMYPPTAKIGIVLLNIAWISHLVSLYFFLKGEIPMTQVILATVTCFLVLVGRNWARILCIGANTMIILWYIPIFLTFYSSGHTQSAGVAGMNICIFSIATFYMARKKTATFYKELNRKYVESYESEKQTLEAKGK